MPSEMILQLMNTMILMIAVTGGLFIALRWSHILRHRESNETNIVVNADKASGEQNVDIMPLASGGFIILNLPEEQKPLFHDLLKGFEEFARVKGYRINFSVDSSVSDRIGFKFTLAEPGVNVSTEQVRSDLSEYIERIKSGSQLNDLPEIISHEEHQLLLTLMKNRINFLQHSYNLEKFSREHYQRLLEEIPKALPTLQAPNIYVEQNQKGGLMDARRYSASNSNHLVQGEHNTLNDLSVSGSVVIGGSPEEIATQKEQLVALIKTLQDVSVNDTDAKNEAVRALDNVRDELIDEETPDSDRVGRWLTKAKLILGKLSLGAEIWEKAQEVFSSFGI